MVEIAKNTVGYSLIAAPGINNSAKTLGQLSQITGRSVQTTSTSLRRQTGEMSSFVQTVTNKGVAIASIEESRGLNNSKQLSEQIKLTMESVNRRFIQVEARNNMRASAGNAALAGQSVIDALKASREEWDRRNGTVSFNFSANLVQSQQQQTPSSVKVNAAKQDNNDVFGRRAPMQANVGGTNTMELRKVALEAYTLPTYLDKGNKALGSIDTVAYRAAGRATPANEGFAITQNGSRADDTIVIDTRDPLNEDGRFSSVTVKAGDGSDVVFVAGQNAARIDAGAGNDFVVAEGETVIDGGAGDDWLYGNTVSGDEGNDRVFASSFASGGAGNDQITLFNLGEEDRGGRIAFGGDGNDILRVGGSAAGGAGNDKLTAILKGDLDGGEGDDDLFLSTGGTASGGAGTDRLNAFGFATMSGGTGDDTASFSKGGTYNFAKGDGSDRVTMSPAEAATDNFTVPTNRVVIDGYELSELTIDAGFSDVRVFINDPNSKDKIVVTRLDANQPMEFVFRKDGFEQIMTVTNTDKVTGTKTRIP
jgi:Ca2+-binding RTX toxin-like protein